MSNIHTNKTKEKYKNLDYAISKANEDAFKKGFDSGFSSWRNLGVSFEKPKGFFGFFEWILFGSFKVVLYADGEKIATATVGYSGTFTVWYKKTNSEGKMLDDLALFKRSLSENEHKELAKESSLERTEQKRLEFNQKQKAKRDGREQLRKILGG